MSTLADASIVAAALLGPVFAVQAQKYLERRREDVCAVDRGRGVPARPRACGLLWALMREPEASHERF
jgi:hypothetical protein